MTIRDAEKHKENPFNDHLVQTISVKTKKRKVDGNSVTNVNKLITSKSGEVEGETQFVYIEQYDEAEFCKVFKSEIRKFAELNKTGNVLFSYIVENLKPNSDEIMLHPQYLADQINDTTLWRGIKELLEKQFIARSFVPYIYFINPNIFFNGDRVSFVRKIVKNKKEKSGQKFVAKNQQNIFGSTITTFEDETDND
jgi:hypothetical protein